jgi:ketopantoate hydroxymethyltransferase
MPNALITGSDSEWTTHGRRVREGRGRYRRLDDKIRAAAREYAEEVRQGRFPAAEHTYSR